MRVPDVSFYHRSWNPATGITSFAALHYHDGINKYIQLFSARVFFSWGGEKREREREREKRRRKRKRKRKRKEKDEDEDDAERCIPIFHRFFFFLKKAAAQNSQWARSAGRQAAPIRTAASPEKPTEKARTSTTASPEKPVEKKRDSPLAFAAAPRFRASRDRTDTARKKRQRSDATTSHQGAVSSWLVSV